jgi:hypothetical protein
VVGRRDIGQHNLGKLSGGGTGPQGNEQRNM